VRSFVTHNSFFDYSCSSTNTIGRLEIECGTSWFMAPCVLFPQVSVVDVDAFKLRALVDAGNHVFAFKIKFEHMISSYAKFF
jgi:hypothetical protein